MVIWITTSLIHIYFVDPFVAWIDAMEEDECVCSYPLVKDEAPDQDPQTIRAWEYAKAEYARVCAIECPPLPIDCKLPRRKGDTDQEYRERCRAVKLGVKEGITRSSFAAEGEEGEDSELDASATEGAW